MKAAIRMGSEIRRSAGWAKVLGGAIRCGLWLGVMVPRLFSAESTPSGSASGVAFFEAKIRPLLSEQCYKCHSASQGKVKGGLELDWKGGWEKGGNTGPAIVPGDPANSLLLKAVSYADPDLQMPPKGEKLSASQIQDLTTWIKNGAADPRVAPAGAVAGQGRWGDESKSHWAFQPIKPQKIPTVEDAAWSRNPVDAFIYARLAENGMKPSEPADRYTLIRRVYFDLIGLPPTIEEVDAFVNDTSPEAYEKVVDQLLASPHYGERWGRHWLDVARYSDTKGQFNRRRESSVYPHAWTYRDYVIESFNQDKPFNAFVMEQLAADRLPASRDNKSLAALGFLTLGDRYNGNQNEIINDRIDVVSKGFLGLTVSCARCHDHKFDPIPQSDYYSLHGIFASSPESMVHPVIGLQSTNQAAYQDYLAERARLDERVLTVSTQLIASAFGDYKRLAAVYLYATQMPVKDQEAYVTKNGGDPELVKNWLQLVRVGTRRETGMFRPWQVLQRLPAARFPEQARRLLAGLGRDERARNLPQALVETFQGQAPKSIGEVAALYGGLFNRPDAAWQAQLRAFMSDVALNIVPNRERVKAFALREQSDRLEMVHPGAPAKAMTLYDAGNGKDSPIFLRGEAENPGKVVPRRFLEALSGPARPAYTNGSGRLQLAQAITSPNNPLTSRVLVNRVWMHHFGEGFVTTPDDFGTQSAPPSHPELLDFLAGQFMKEGWSIKKLHKHILLSQAYQQSSAARPEYATRDPENRWLSHANLRRLEFEPLRDSILYLGGKLDLTVGGKPVDLGQGLVKSADRRPRERLLQGSTALSTAERRSVYGYVDRMDLLEMLNTFDFANPTLPSGKRYQTTVPQQALFLMNSPIVVEQARNIVDRKDFQSRANDDEKIMFLYQLFFQRNPTREELQMGQEFLAQAKPASDQALIRGGGDEGLPMSQNGVMAQAKPKLRDRLKNAPAKPSVRPISAWAEYAHALMMTTEMSFVR